MNAKKPNFLDLDRRFYTYLWPYRLQLGLMLVTMAGAAVMDIASPWPFKFIVDNVIGKKPYGDALLRQLAASLYNDPYLMSISFVAMLVVFALLGGAMTFVYGYLQGMIQERTTFRLRSHVFAHLQSLSLAYHDQSRSGELMARVTSDAANVMDALVHTTGEVAINFLNFAGVAIAMFFINWRFSFIALAYAPLLYVLFRHFRRKIRAAADAARTEDGQILNVTHETLSGIRVVKAYGREAHEQHRFEEHGVARLYAGLQSALWGASFEPIIDLIKALSLATVILYGTYTIFAGDLTVGELLIFISYMSTFYNPLKRFSKLAGMLQVGAVSGQRLTQLLDTQSAVRDAPRAQSINRAAGRIEFRRVSFSYENAAAHALGDLSFVARPGQRIAIVGATGAGKSTLVNLMMRFYDPLNGEILLDGTNLRRIRLENLKQQFALVPQEALLFAVSVRQNIAYGKPDAGMHRIMEAAQAAHAHEFIMRMPDGYDTVLAERGASLSVGQRQRIAIARAVLQDAPILILDEPTSALDSITEYQTMEALERLMQGRTTFIIAHRLSTSRHADRILVIAAGRLIEFGTHDELMALRGYYSELVRLQTGDLNPPARPAPINTPRRGLSWVLAGQAPENQTRYSTREIAALLRETLNRVPSD
jgi:ATP-binding cassette subfamily B protein